MLPRADQTMAAIAKLKISWKDKNIGMEHKIRLMRALSPAVILQGAVEGKRRRGMPKKRWIDNIAEWTGKSVALGDSSHGTQPAGVERADEEIRHDASCS